MTAPASSAATASTAGNKAKQAHQQNVAGKAMCKLGLGGNLVVHGDHDSIQAVRRLMADCASLHRRNEFQFVRLLRLKQEKQALRGAVRVLCKTLLQVQRQAKADQRYATQRALAWEDAARSLQEKVGFLEAVLKAMCASKHRFWRVLGVLIFGK